METWLIVLIAALVAVALYFIFKRQTVNSVEAPTPRPIASAPGVSPTTGNVIPDQPSITEGATNPAIRVRTAGVPLILSPVAALENVPVQGSAPTPASSVGRVGASAVNKINNVGNAVLEHVPVVGKPLVAATKQLQNVTNKAVHTLSLGLF